LAVAIGTAHGLYKGVPKLDFDLLKEIKDTVRIPLVLHGGSGTGDENLRKACKMGINKVNVFSELAAGAYAEVKKVDLDKEPPYLLFAHIRRFPQSSLRTDQGVRQQRQELVGQDQRNPWEADYF
jgi:fructose/tagatose bisphosphate aldolase